MLGIAAPVVGSLLSGVGSIRIGGHYTGGPFVPDGLQNWYAAGHLDYIRQVATTGKGPHWSEPDKHGIVTYAAVDQQAARDFLNTIQTQGAPTAPIAQPQGPSVADTVAEAVRQSLESGANATVAELAARAAAGAGAVAGATKVQAERASAFTLPTWGKWALGVGAVLAVVVLLVVLSRRS